MSDVSDNLATEIREELKDDTAGIKSDLEEVYTKLMLTAGKMNEAA